MWSVGEGSFIGGHALESASAQGRQNSAPIETMMPRVFTNLNAHNL
jgi:hypothetical protein